MKSSLPWIEDRDATELAVASLRQALWPGVASLTLADRRRLVGRETEVADLLARLQQSASGESPVVWLHGDSGVGKTSLVLAGVMARWSADYGKRLLWFHCLPDEESSGSDLIDAIASSILAEITGHEESSVDLAGRMRQFTLLLRENTSEDAVEYLAACFQRSTPQGAIGALFLDQFGRCIDRLTKREDPSIGALLHFLRDLSLTGVFPIVIAFRSYQLPSIRRALEEGGLPEFGEWIRVELPPSEALGEFLVEARSARHPRGAMRLTESLGKKLAGNLQEWPLALPLVSELLASISREDPDADEIDIERVDWFGGVERVFAEAADRATSGFDLSSDTGAKRTLERLMALTGTEQDREISYQALVGDDDPDGRSLVHSLVNERVLQICGDSAEMATVKWTYPPGLETWEWSGEWLREAERLAARIGRFEEARHRWEREWRSPVCLIHASRLIDDARQLLGRHRNRPCLEAPLVEFLETSIELDERLRGEMHERKTRRWFWIGGSAAAIVILVFLMISMGR